MYNELRGDLNACNNGKMVGKMDVGNALELSDPGLFVDAQLGDHRSPARPVDYSPLILEHSMSSTKQEGQLACSRTQKAS